MAHGAGTVVSSVVQDGVMRPLAAERWRAALRGATRCRAREAPGGERWRAAAGGDSLTAQGAELRAAGQRKVSACARRTARSAKRCEMARGAGW
eukprot:2121098-Pleurochrysis_carterae.AAC.1